MTTLPCPLSLSLSPCCLWLPSSTSRRTDEGNTKEKGKFILFSFLLGSSRKTDLELLCEMIYPDYFKILISVFPFGFTTNNECMLGCHLAGISSKKRETSLTCIWNKFGGSSLNEALCVFVLPYSIETVRPSLCLMWASCQWPDPAHQFIFITFYWPTATPVRLYTVCGCFLLRGQNRVAEKETIWPIKPKLFIFRHFMEKAC